MSGRESRRKEEEGVRGQGRPRPGLLKISREGRRLSPASVDGGAACSKAGSGGARSEGGALERVKLTTTI